MQLKLLNFYKALANFAASLVGGFIPLIIYRQTQNLFWAVFYIVAMYTVNFIFNQIFKNQLVKRPQLFLVLRTITILGYSLSVLVIESSFILGVILVIIFVAGDSTFKTNSAEIILNYSVSQNTNSKSFGLTRVFEQTGTIIAMVAGGLFLDYLSTFVLIAVAIGIYLLSTIPLLIYYIRSRKLKDFNKESVSNAFIYYSQYEDKTKLGKKVSKQILLQYGFIYFLVAFLDVFCNLFNLHLYVKLGQFSLAGYLNGIYNATYALSSYLVGYVSAKRDTTIIASICLIINGICTFTIGFVSNVYIIFALFAIIGFAYPFYSLFLIERMLTKTRILGISNKAILTRDNASVVGKWWCALFAMFGTIFPAFLAMGFALTACGVALPENEESTRKALVNYLEGN